MNCICSLLEVRSPNFRHVCKTCYHEIKKSPSVDCLADCHRLETDTPYYVVCMLCYETIHEKVTAPTVETPEPVKDVYKELVADIKRASKKAKA